MPAFIFFSKETLGPYCSQKRWQEMGAYFNICLMGIYAKCTPVRNAVWRACVITSKNVDESKKNSHQSSVYVCNAPSWMIYSNGSGKKSRPNSPEATELTKYSRASGLITVKVWYNFWVERPSVLKVLVRFRSYINFILMWSAHSPPGVIVHIYA